MSRLFFDSKVRTSITVNPGFAMSMMLVLGLCIASVHHAYADELFELISPAEAEQALAQPGEDEAFQTKGSIGAPIIKVVSPTVDSGELSSPVDIEILFESPDDTDIDMESLKILYVMMIKKDVTDRILKHASLSKTSLIAKGAKLPEGQHKFIVEIQDVKQRKTREKFAVSVSG